MDIKGKMKTTLLALLLVSSFTAFADYDEEQITNEITRIESEKLDTKEKKSFLQNLKIARNGYKEWKEKNSNHAELRKEMKLLKKKISTKDSPENRAIVQALKTCKTNPKNCNLEGALESIALNSDLPHLAKSKSFNIMPTAYAAGIKTLTCSSDAFLEDGLEYQPDLNHLLLIGGSKYCGISQFGPGLLLSITASVAVCTGNPGTQAGVAAQATTLLGAGLSMTFGQGGMCISLSSVLGLGAFAGIQVVDFKKGNWE